MAQVEIRSLDIRNWNPKPQINPDLPAETVEIIPETLTKELLKGIGEGQIPLMMLVVHKKGIVKGIILIPDPKLTVVNETTGKQTTSLVSERKICDCRLNSVRDAAKALFREPYDPKMEYVSGVVAVFKTFFAVSISLNQKLGLGYLYRENICKMNPQLIPQIEAIQKS